MEDRAMKTILLFILQIFLLSAWGGCILSGTPLKSPVLILPGESATFKVYGFPDNSHFNWYLDGAEVQSTGNSYDYMALDNSAASHILVAKESGSAGSDTYSWIIVNSPDTFPSSSNNPHVPPGPGPWFEGWYTRVSDINGSRSIAIICASHLPKGETYVPGVFLPGYINILISEGDGSPTLSYTVFPEKTMALVDGRPVVKNPRLGSPADFEWVAEGYGNITEDSVDISIPGVLDIHFKTKNRIPWNERFFEARPEGLLSLLPLPLNWHIHSLGSDAEYEYTIFGDEGASTTTGAGYAHQEKNWGAGFPVGWVWTQGIAEDNQAHFVATLANVEIGPIGLDAWLAAYRSASIAWDFRFNAPGTVLHIELDACEGTLYLEATDSNRRLTIDAIAPPDTFGDVSIPTQDGFAPESGGESFSATITVSAYDANVLLEERVFYNAALEFGAGYVCRE